jgi:hypothetical protein
MAKSPTFFLRPIYKGEGDGEKGKIGAGEGCVGRAAEKGKERVNVSDLQSVLVEGEVHVELRAAGLPQEVGGVEAPRVVDGLLRGEDECLVQDAVEQLHAVDPALRLPLGLVTLQLP